MIPTISLFIILFSWKTFLFASNPKKLFLLFFPILFIYPVLGRILYGAFVDMWMVNIFSITITFSSLLIFTFSYRYFILKNKSKDETVLKLYAIYSLIPFIIGFLNYGIIATWGLYMTLVPLSFFFVIKYSNININSLLNKTYLILILIISYETFEFLFGMFDWDLNFVYKYIDDIYLNTIVDPSGSLLKNITSYNLTYPVAMLLTLSLIDLFERKTISKANKVFTITAIILFVVTLERTPIVSVIGGCYFYFLVKFLKKKEIFKILIYSFLLVALLLSFKSNILEKLPQDINKYKRFSELSNPLEADNIKARQIRWSTAYEKMLSPKAVIGYGLMHYTADPKIPRHRGLHSELFNQIIEYGYIGLILLLIFLAILFMPIIKKRFSYEYLKYCSSIITFIVLGIANSPFLISSTFFFWLFSGYLSRLRIYFSND